MINKAILVGNVGKDPEVRYLESGVAVAQFSLATSESFKDKAGNKTSRTEWHNIVVWRGLAEVVEKYVKKGQSLYIEGKITTRSYEKDGIKRYSTEIVASEMKMLSNKNSGGGEGSYAGGEASATGNTTQAAQPAQPDTSANEPMETDDLPF